MLYYIRENTVDFVVRVTSFGKKSNIYYIRRTVSKFAHANLDNLSLACKNHYKV